MGQRGDLWTTEEIILRVNNGEKVIMPTWQLHRFLVEAEGTRMELHAQFIPANIGQIIIIAPFNEELKRDKDGNIIL